MLSILYGTDWVFWEAYSPPNFLGEQKVVFDGPNKLILVSEGVTELDFRVDVYSAWKEWVLEPNHVNSKFAEAIVAVGGDPLPGDRSLGTTYFLENEWRMRTWEGDHQLTMTGNVFTREGAPIFVNTLEPWTISINLNTSTLVETIIPTISLGDSDVSAVATAVWEEILSGSEAGDILVSILNNTASANATVTASEVWSYIIDTSKNQSAGDKLKKIATKIQDIALS